MRERRADHCPTAPLHRSCRKRSRVAPSARTPPRVGRRAHLRSLAPGVNPPLPRTAPGARVARPALNSARRAPLSPLGARPAHGLVPGPAAAPSSDAERLPPRAPALRRHRTPPKPRPRAAEPTKRDEPPKGAPARLATATHDVATATRTTTATPAAVFGRRVATGAERRRHARRPRPTRRPRLPAATPPEGPPRCEIAKRAKAQHRAPPRLAAATSTPLPGARAAAPQRRQGEQGEGACDDALKDVREQLEGARLTGTRVPGDELLTAPLAEEGVGPTPTTRRRRRGHRRATDQPLGGAPSRPRQVGAMPSREGVRGLLPKRRLRRHRRNGRKMSKVGEWGDNLILNKRRPTGRKHLQLKGSSRRRDGVQPKKMCVDATASASAARRLRVAPASPPRSPGSATTSGPPSTRSQLVEAGGRPGGGEDRQPALRSRASPRRDLTSGDSGGGKGD